MTAIRKSSLILSILLATLPVSCLAARSAQQPQTPESFYYSFDKKIAGRLDTSILAVQVPHGMSREAFNTTFESAGRFLSEDEPYVKAFEQEGIVFLQLGESIDTAGFLSLNASFLSVSEKTRVGHPFFVEGEKYPLILTKEFIARFKPEVSEGQITTHNRDNGVQVVKRNPHVKNQFLLSVTEACGVNAMEMGNRYQESGLVQFSHPNFLVHIEYYQHTPPDPDFGAQWHLRNSGGSGMTADADIDADDAWEYERGETSVVVAVIDGGFEITHDDLDDNHFVNAAEQAGSGGVDDDGNGYVDDIDGWSFVDASDDVDVGLWPYHGQSVAGLVAAEENNLMVVGACPSCRLLFIANNFDIDDLANAFYYARDRGAWVITNSWGATGTTLEQPALIAAINDVANNGRGSLGIPIFFASGNDGGSTVAYPARDLNTIAIGGADCNNVRYTGSQYGPELDALSPTRQGDGTCGLVTTDLGNTVGTSFGGTSGATPIAAGIGGLLLSLNSNLTGQQVREILRATAEQIEPAVANYDADGFSNTHGYGRANAHRAVVPTVKISVSPTRVRRNRPFTVKVTASAPYGLTAVWWFGQGTGIPAIDQAHWQTVAGEPVYTYTWTNVRINRRGTFTLGANARDVRYPTPGDGYPHQASEGSGIANTQIRVTPVTTTLGLLALGLSFSLSGAASFRQRRSG